MNHLAIIADGNRRWATQHNLPQEHGYWQGLKTIEHISEWAINNNIKYLTFYCLSTENWKREEKEIKMLFQLAEFYFKEQIDWYVERKIKVQFIGRRDHFKQNFVEMMESLEKITFENDRLILSICIDYGGRDEIIRAIEAGARTEQEINDFINQFYPEPEAILRTGGNKRLSNFLTWHSIYSELFFLEIFFPDLRDKQLDKVLQEYNLITRNFGK